jgi:hypothetical protein
MLSSITGFGNGKDEAGGAHVTCLGQRLKGLLPARQTQTKSASFSSHPVQHHRSLLTYRFNIDESHQPLDLKGKPSSVKNESASRSLLPKTAIDQNGFYVKHNRDASRSNPPPNFSIWKST